MKKKILTFCSIIVMSFCVFASTAAAAAAKCPPHQANSGTFAGNQEVYSFTHSYVEYVDARGKSHNAICSVRVYDKTYRYNCIWCNDFLYYGTNGQDYVHSSCGQ